MLQPLGISAEAEAVYVALGPLPSASVAELARLTSLIPEKVAATLETVDLTSTLVNVVTKSGQTAETMANFLAVQQALQAAVGPAGVEVEARAEGNRNRVARQ